MVEKFLTSQTGFGAGGMIKLDFIDYHVTAAKNLGKKKEKKEKRKKAILKQYNWFILPITNAEQSRRLC